MANISFQKIQMIISLTASSCIVACSKSPSAAENKAGSASSIKSVMAPQAPANKLSGDGFGLEGTTTGNAAPTTTTTTPASTTIPKGAIAAQGGGYWDKPTVEADKAVGGTGVLQYYDKTGAAQQWFGGYGAPKNGVYQSDASNTSTFTMMKGINNTLDPSQQFVVNTGSNGWANANGQILNSQGQPYSIPGTNGQKIVSQGFNYGTNGMNYNWLANDGTGSEMGQKLFKTSGYDLNQGAMAGMTYYDSTGKAIPYQPTSQYNPNSIGNGSFQTQPLGGMTPIAGFLSALFR